MASAEPADLPGVTIGLDVGERRIGIASSDALGVLATPRGAIMRETDSQAVGEIERLAVQMEARQIVVGVPLGYAGEMTPQAQRIHAFARKLRRIRGVRLVFWDESNSTVTAGALLPPERGEANARTRRQREDARRRLDAAAAAVILQEYLDHRRGSATRAEPLEQ